MAKLRVLTAQQSESGRLGDLLKLTTSTGLSLPILRTAQREYVWFCSLTISFAC
jgi:hypothetical protein